MRIKNKAPAMAAAPPVAPQARPARAAVKMVAPKLQRVTCRVRSEPGRKVFLAGSFNHWDPTAKEMVDKNNDGLYCATLTLPEGAHQYKFVIDGTWCADPACANWVQNEYGTHNSVMLV